MLLSSQEVHSSNCPSNILACLENLFTVSILFLVPLVSMPFLFITGAFGWTFTEYALHRWLFHRDPPTTSYFLITLHFLLHGQHHKVRFEHLSSTIFSFFGL